jgi:hypothetical protein
MMNTTMARTEDRRTSAAAEPAVDPSSHSRSGRDRDTAARTGWSFEAEPAAWLAPPPPASLVLHPRVVVDGSDDARRDDANGDNYDCSDLQGLISLAKRPFGRATETCVSGKGGPSSSIGLTMTTATRTTAPTTEAPRLPPPTQLPPRHIKNSTTGGEVATAVPPRKRAAVQSPMSGGGVREKRHRRAFRPLPLSSLHANRHYGGGGVVRSDHRDGKECISVERGDEEKNREEEDDDTDSSSCSSIAVAVPLPPQAAADVSASDDGAGTGAVADGPSRARDLRCKRAENRAFVIANFDHDAGALSSHAARCRVCSQQVPCPRRRTVPELLRHSMTSSCLLRRAERLLRLCRGSQGHAADDTESDAVSFASSASKTAVSDAIWGYLRRNYDDDQEPPPAPAAGAAAPAHPRARTRAAKTTCRHCSAVVTKKDSHVLFRHLAGCVGIDAVVQEATQTVRHALLLLSNCPPSSTAKASVAAAVKGPPPKPPQPPPPSQESEVRETPSGRTEIEIHEQNRSFLASTFVLAAVDSAGEVCRCVVCDQRIPRRGVPDLFRHAIGLSCFSRRVERALLANAAKGDMSAPHAPAASPSRHGQRSANDTRHLRISDACAGLVQSSRTSAALQEYRGRHFARAAVDPSLPLWKCRRCGALVRGCEIHVVLLHRITCVGIVSVVRDLEGALAAIVQSIVGSSWNQSPPPSTADDSGIAELERSDASSNRRIPIELPYRASGKEGVEAAPLDFFCGACTTNEPPSASRPFKATLLLTDGEPIQSHSVEADGVPADQPMNDATSNNQWRLRP